MTERLMWFDWLGLGGIAAILVAQLLLQTGVWRGDRPVFQAINLMGALCTLFSLVYTLNLTAFVALPLAWALISGIGLYLTFRRRPGPPAPGPAGAGPHGPDRGAGGPPPF